jgi:hypothetical protein
MSDTFPRKTHNKPLKFVPLRSTGRELRARRLAERYMIWAEARFGV